MSQPDPKKPQITDWDILKSALFFGAIAGLIGFGMGGTLQSACLSAGLCDAAVALLCFVMVWSEK